MFRKDKIHIDKVFQEISANHQEKYLAEDWTSLQNLLQKQGLQQKNPAWQRVKRATLKVVALASVLVLVLPLQINNPIQSIKESQLARIVKTLPQKSKERNISEGNNQRVEQSGISILNQNQETPKLNAKTEVYPIPYKKKNEVEGNIKKVRKKNQKSKSSETLETIKPIDIFATRPIRQELDFTTLTNTLPKSNQVSALKPERQKGKFWQLFRNHQEDEDLKTSEDREKSLEQKKARLSAKIDFPEHPKIKFEQKTDRFFSMLKPKMKRTDTLSVDSTLILVDAYDTRIDSVNTDHKVQNFDFGIIYPLSTHKASSLRYVNRFSLHLLAQFSAGVKGFEASSLANYSKEYVEGLQLAGLVNITGKSVNGVQVAGLTNFNSGRTRGIQLAGLLNASGFEPIKKEESKTIVGANVQLAGLANINLSTPQHLQVASLTNISREVRGIQLGGLANLTDKLEGVQVSGLVNFAREVRGVQIGLLNIADSVRGVPIGLVSIVRKNGYRKVSAWGNETLNANVALKMGVRTFYNIFAIGGSFVEEDIRWGLGYGFGSEVKFSETFYMSLEALSYQVYESKAQREPFQHLNLFNQFKINFIRQVKPNLGLFFSPSLNVLFSKSKNSDGFLNSQIAPSWTFYNERPNPHTKVKMWFGFDVGFRF